MPTTPNFVKDNLLLHYHAARANGMGRASNTPAATVWKDLSGNGLDGTLKQFSYSEGSGWSAAGLVFDGVDDHIEVVSNGMGVFDKQQFTVEVWALPELSSQRVLWDYSYSAEGPYYSVHLQNTVDGTKNIYYLGFNYDEKHRVRFSEFPANLDISKPIQYVSTFDWKEQKSYLNGIEGQAGVWTGYIHYAANPLYIGKALYDAQMMFKGAMYIVRYYTKVLTSAEVAQNYTAGIAWPNDTKEVLAASAKVIERKNKLCVV